MKQGPKETTVNFNLLTLIEATQSVSRLRHRCGTHFRVFIKYGTKEFTSNIQVLVGEDLIECLRLLFILLQQSIWFSYPYMCLSPPILGYLK